MGWCYAAASVTGVSHTRAGTRLQDANQCFDLTDGRGDQCFLAIVSDGAGSAPFGGQGASIVCRSIALQARDQIRSATTFADDETIWSWIDLTRDRICLAASRRGRTARDFAATLVLVMASRNEIITVHVGDGAIVARDRETSTWTCLSKPHKGEYASTTFFVTDDPTPALRICRYANQFDALAAFSDGIENLVIDSVTQQPSAGFFNPMARPLEASQAVGKDASLCKSLELFLGSDRIDQLTDDDKTLVVAVER